MFGAALGHRGVPPGSAQRFRGQHRSNVEERQADRPFDVARFHWAKRGRWRSDDPIKARQGGELLLILSGPATSHQNSGSRYWRKIRVKAQKQVWGTSQLLRRGLDQARPGEGLGKLLV